MEWLSIDFCDLCMRARSATTQVGKTTKQGDASGKAAEVKQLEVVTARGGRTKGSRPLTASGIGHTY